MIPQPEDVVAVLAQHREELRGSGVASLLLFGSVARGQATEASDIDLVVEFDRAVGLFALLRLQARAARSPTGGAVRGAGARAGGALGKVGRRIAVRSLAIRSESVEASLLYPSRWSEDGVALSELVPRGFVDRSDARAKRHFRGHRHLVGSE
jgi:hypothetical protein